MLAVAVALAVATGSAAVTTATAQQEKPGTSSEFDFSPPSGPPGTDIRVSGKCEWQGSPGERAFVSLGRRADDGGQPIETHRSYTVQPDTTFAGDLPVPQDFPSGSYTLSMDCYVQDEAFGTQQRTFTVTPGPPIGTTTTTTTTLPNARPPIPVVAAANLTG